jgi:hypothetical protein
MERRRKVGYDKPLNLLDCGSPPGPTTQSHADGNFLRLAEKPPFGGLGGGAHSLSTVN